MTELVSRSDVSRTVLKRMETGDPSVGIGKIFNVLDALGFLSKISDIASPERDREQVLNEIKKLREGIGEGKDMHKKNRLIRFE